MEFETVYVKYSFYGVLTAVAAATLVFLFTLGTTEYKFGYHEIVKTPCFHKVKFYNLNCTEGRIVGADGSMYPLLDIKYKVCYDENNKVCTMFRENEISEL